MNNTMPYEKSDKELMLTAADGMRLQPFASAPYAPATLATPFSEFEQSEPGVPLSHYFWVIKRHRWKALSFIVATVLATIIVSKRITPIYDATATIDIDRQSPTAVVGQEASRSS